MMAGYSVRVTTGRAVRVFACVTAALAGLAVAVVAGAHAHAMDTAPPSAARRPPGGYSPGTGFGEVDAVTALAAAARLAALRPSAGLAPGALFTSLGTPGVRSVAQHPIPVVYRDAAAIDGYTVAAGAGAVCCLAALVLLPALARRSRTT
jgi:hypothetical protein